MTAQDRINDYWTGRAPSYAEYQRQPARLADDLAAWSQVWAGALPPAPLDVLDVGTGSGQVAGVLAGLGHRVTGIDLSPGMLEQARSTYGNVGFRLGDAVEPPFPPSSFDAVTGRYVMWTLRDPGAAVANWMRLLRPGGTVAVVDSTWFPDGPQSFYDPSVWEALPLAQAESINQTAAVLEQAGLADVTVTPLTTIYELDEKYGVAPGHELQTQYLITGHV
ncbi:methyltransferase domain-containing protein [Actinoplanes sp. LDG1-06]|uniref:Methyltransferase domain-containing protein n=1 Tax=Paractinoplanes ovalisporus TaxID=2810368 RepID=A0ABS2ARS0_9ACTN|nr:class I SAM-dependent methyltransferase [Actinoplanes ovalisporus]MBM2621859.1 methyltransferase domain-containing protein [Actinoplanes ovalisporus]